MTKANITEYDKTAANNTDVQDVPLGENLMFPANVNNAFREIMADLADMNDGTVTLTSPAVGSIGVTGNITVGGTVDGRDVATDGTKLDGVEASADVTDTANVTAAGAAMLTGATFTGSITAPDATFNGTTAVKLPAGTGAQRPTGVNGMLRYNSDDAQFEGYAGGAWGAIAGGETLIINGAMVIDQRNSGSAVTGSASAAKYAADRFSLYANTTATITAQQVSDAPNGFQKSDKITCTSAATGDGTGSRVQFSQAIEGHNMSHLQFGSATAKTITLSFYVKASNAGTYGGSFTNGSVNRAYPYSYTISSANTWEYKTVTIAGDTSGTWATDNTAGIIVFWGLGVGSDFEGTANQWNGAFDIAPSSSFSLKDNLNATWQVTGVRVEVGSVATEFQHRSFGEELALCQRYYQSINTGTNQAIAFGTRQTTNTVRFSIPTPVTFRANPSITISGAVECQESDGTTTSITSISAIQSSGNYVVATGTASGVQAGSITVSANSGTTEIDAEL
jgi:hypothetical protein